MPGVEVINRYPIELRAEILLHARHQPTCQILEIVILCAVLRRDDEPELVAVALRLVEPRLAIDFVGVGAIELAASTVAGRAVALDVAHMGARCRRSLAGELHDPRFDDDPARAKRRITIAATEYPADARAASDPAAVEAAAPAGYPGATAGEIGGRENLGEELTPLLTALGGHAPQAGFEVVIAEHAGHRKYGRECRS